MSTRTEWWAMAAAALTLTVLAGACSNQATSGTSGTNTSLPSSCQQSKPVLGVALPNTVNPYYVAMRQSFLDNGAAAGFNVKISIVSIRQTTAPSGAWPTISPSSQRSSAVTPTAPSGWCASTR